MALYFVNVKTSYSGWGTITCASILRLPHHPGTIIFSRFLLVRARRERKLGASFGSAASSSHRDISNRGCCTQAKRKSDLARRYQQSPMWGDTANEAFASVKKAIVDLLRAAENDQMDAVRASRISPLFKGKLLYLYFPQKFAPVYSLDHLRHFAAELNLVGPFKGAVDIQRALMTYRLFVGKSITCSFGQCLDPVIWVQ